MHIAIIGSGVAGLSAAYLFAREHRVVVFERSARPGGHAHTHLVRDGDGEWPLDTGFMVYNERTYPNFVRLLAQLGVETRPSDMSFGVRCHRCRLEFSSRGLRGLFAQPWRVADPRHLRTLRDALAFFRAGRRFLSGAPDERLSLGDFLARERLSDVFARHFLLPMGGAIWSASGADLRRFPAHAFLRFFDNHGLLAVHDAPVWRTIVGGSRRYVEALIRHAGVTMHLDRPVERIRREPEGVVVSVNGETMRFDQVVIATHADEALSLLGDASDAEYRALARVTYSRNRTILHTDETTLPVRPAARASWNCELIDCHDESAPAALTYDISRLQGIASRSRYCVSLNRVAPTAGEAIASMDYRHPVMDAHAFLAQREIASLNGTNRTWYCGAWLRYGFHEDGLVSALRVAERFGLTS